MLDVKRTDTWVRATEDRVGSLRDALQGLAKAGVDLEFLVCRRTHETPGRGIMFVAPIVGEVQERLAHAAGFRPSESLHTLRVTGGNEAGTGFLIAEALAQEGIDIAGVSAAVLGNQFVMYLAFDSERDAAQAAQRLLRGV
jgi:predicted amino acid-binding ACT domain protein